MEEKEDRRPTRKVHSFVMIETRFWTTVLILYYILSACSWGVLSLTNSNGFIPFQHFEFAINDVCTKPSIFYADSSYLNEDHKGPLEFTMRNVPGEGDCMFQAVALGTLTSMGLGGNSPLLKSVADEIRTVMAQILTSPKGNLYVEGRRVMKVRNLLLAASKAEGLSPQEYITALTNRTLQGGGPELTILSNVLRRPISIYELDDGVESQSIANVNEKQGTVPERYRIREVGLFGEIFRDPCCSIPDSAILSDTLQQGAYSWHIHILVLDSGNNEKHACTLLPKSKLVGSNK